VGVAARDSICRKLAGDAGLPAADSFLAYLSAAVSIDAGDRFTIDGPWRRVDHYPVAVDAAQLASGRLTGPISLDENGVPSSAQVWTGTGVDGFASGFTCDDWESGSGVGSWGWASSAATKWVRFGDTEGCATDPYASCCFGDRVVLFWNDFEGGSWTPEWSDTVGMVP